MKKLAFACFAAFVLLVSGVAEAGGHGWHGGGWHGGGGRWGGWRGGGWGWGGGVAFYPRVVIGGPGPFWWGNPYRYYGGGPYWGGGYWGGGYGAPYAVPVPVAPPQPQVYVQQQQPAGQYWYYCQDPKGYYPYVEKCHDEWMQVVPNDESPQPR